MGKEINRLTSGWNIPAGGAVTDREIRPELAAFAKVMESRLKENAHRGEWRTFKFCCLAACPGANLGHMIRAYQADKPESILKSAAGAANHDLRQTQRS